MESNRRRRRRRDNKPKQAPKPKTIKSSSLSSSSSPIGAATSSTVDYVPDHVLELILLRLDSYLSLVRAACACRQWCRVVADAGLLSRFHPLRPAAPPLILGHYYRAPTQPPAFVPSPTPGIRKRSREPFSLDFVPSKLDGGAGAWEIADSRDTLLLLLSKSKKDDLTTTTGSTSSSSSFNNDDPDLVVCRPLTRRYEAISLPKPEQLAGRQCLGFFLVDGVDGGRSIGLSNFRVVALLLRDHMLARGRGVPVACVYTPGNGTDRRCSWRDVRCTWTGDVNIPITAGSFYFLGRANGSLYWAIRGRVVRAALVLDEATMGVSVVELPVAIDPLPPLRPLESRCFTVIDGEDGAVSLRAVHLVVNDVRVYARLRVAGEWVVQNLLPLPVLPGVHGSPWIETIVAAHQTYVIVSPRDSMQVYSVDLKTMAFTFVARGTMDSGGPAYPYQLPWPPTLLDLDLEAAADNSSNPQIQGPRRTKRKRKAKQNIGASLFCATASLFCATLLLSFSLTMLLLLLLLSFCGIKNSGQ